MADLAIHRTVIVREFDPAVGGRGGIYPPCFAVTQKRFGIGGLRIVVRRCRINRIDRLRNFPANFGRHAGLLPKLVALPRKPGAKGGVTGIEQIDFACVARRDKVRPLPDCPMAIDAADGRSVSRFAVEHAVPVHVDVKMAITALHAVC